MSDLLTQVDYAVLGALSEELEFFTQQFAEAHVSFHKVHGLDFKIYDYGGAKILVSATGIGSSFAASIFTLVHCYFKPSYFLLTGTAGAISNSLKINDVVIAETAFEAEFISLIDSVKETPFATCLTFPLTQKNLPMEYKANADLLRLCKNMSGEFYSGTVVSSTTFPAPQALFQKIIHRNALAIDMETTAIYQIAWMLQAKVLAIRGISNLLDRHGADENIAQAHVKSSAAAAAKLTLKVIQASIANNKNDVEIYHKN